MIHINRRQLIAGTMMLLGDAHLPKALAIAGANRDDAETSIDPTLPLKPKEFLSAAFTPEVLSTSLASRTAWHPYPKAPERELWQAVPDDVRDATIRRAEAALGTEWASLPATIFLEYKRTGNRTHYEQLYFIRRGRLGDLVLGECVEGKGRFLDEIANGIWLICEETFWGLPAHLGLQKAGIGLPDVSEPVVDLFAAQTSQMLSWTHYLLGAELDRISPLITKRIEIEAKRRILDPAFERNDFWWMWTGNAGTGFRLNNWNPWINSNWMVTNLLLEADPDRRIKATSKICRSLDQYLADYSPDGACEEGSGYWGASTGCYFDCLSILTSATGREEDVFSNLFVRKMMHYIVDVHIADHYAVNYGDAHAKGGPPAELAYQMGAATKDKVLEMFGAFYIAPVTNDAQNRVSAGAGSLTRPLADMMHVADARLAKKADALERDSWYPALCLMTTRTAMGTSKGFYLAVQAAPNLRSHGHNDSGSFIVFHDGEPIFIDVGPEAYTAKTFSSERYSIWTMQSAYHNLPTVGGVMQSAKEAKYRATGVYYTNEDARTGLSMNLATAYPDEAGIVRWLRSITLERNEDRIRLREDFQLRQKAPVSLSFMTSRTPSHGQQGSILLSAADEGAKDVILKYDSSLATPNFKQITLTDEGLRRTWGKTIYRILLTSTEPTDGGQWTMDII